MEKEKVTDRTQPFVDAVLKEFGLRMINQEKVGRAVFGISTSRGLVDGVGEKASPEVILAKYDQYAGAIFKDEFKVKPGQFFDKETKKPIRPDAITLLIRMNGEYVEFKEGEKETPEIQVAKKQAKAKKEKKVKDE